MFSLLFLSPYVDKKRPTEVMINLWYIKRVLDIKYFLSVKKMH